MVCLKETKSDNRNFDKLYEMWGSNKIDWVENEAINNVGGGKIILI